MKLTVGDIKKLIKDEELSDTDTIKIFDNYTGAEITEVVSLDVRVGYETVIELTIDSHKYI